MMKNRHISKRDLYGYQAGEINGKKRKSIESHLKLCRKCTAEYNQILSVQEILNRLPRPEPKEQYLENCRGHLFQSLENRRSALPFLHRAQQTVGFIFGSGQSPRLIPALTIFIMGIFLGNIINFDFIQGRNQTAAAFTGYVESIQYNDNGSQLYPVKITFKEKGLNIIEGSPSDPKLIDAAIYILKNEDRDDLRIKAVKILENSGKSPKIRNALLNRLHVEKIPESA